MGRFRAAHLEIMFAGILALAASLTAQAHHSFAMFDHAKTVTIKGTVETFKWGNPHVHITVIVPLDAKGGGGKWDIECASTNIMVRQGWNRLSIKPGDAITIVGNPMKDGTQGLSLIYAITPSGQKLWQDVSRPGTKTPG